METLNLFDINRYRWHFIINLALIPFIILFSTPFIFAYSDQMGRVGLEYEDIPDSGILRAVWSEHSQGNQWDQSIINLSAEDNTDERQLTSNSTVAGIQSDMAVDEITIIGRSNTPPHLSDIISFEDFESGFTTWTNTSGDDNDCWTRDSSGTPTINTGPSTGAAGTTFYVYYESSIGTACGGAELDQAFLLGPIIDFDQFNGVEVQFWRHMWDGGSFNGDDMGRLALELEDSPGSGTFTEVWFQQGSKGNHWDHFTINLSSEDNTGNRQLRFVATDIGVGVQRVLPDLDFMIYKGIQYNNLGDYETAISIYKEVLKMNKDNVQALTNLGHSFFLNKNYNQAINHFEQALTINPDDNLALYRLQIALLETSSYKLGFLDGVLEIKVYDSQNRLTSYLQSTQIKTLKHPISEKFVDSWQISKKVHRNNQDYSIHQNEFVEVMNKDTILGFHEIPFSDKMDLPFASTWHYQIPVEKGDIVNYVYSFYRPDN